MEFPALWVDATKIRSGNGVRNHGLPPILLRPCGPNASQSGSEARSGLRMHLSLIVRLHVGFVGSRRAPARNPRFSPTPHLGHAPVTPCRRPSTPGSQGVRGEAAVAQGADRPARRPQDARRAGGIGRRARRGRRRADDRGRGDSSSCLPPRSRFATAAASRRPCASTAFRT